MIKTLQTATIKRFMNDEEFAAFYEKYKANVTATRVLRKADATDLQVFADFKGGATIGALAKSTTNQTQQFVPVSLSLRLPNLA